MPSQTAAKVKKGWAIPVLAAAYDVSVRYIYKEIERGKLEAVHIGATTRVTEASRARWDKTFPRFKSGRPLACGSKCKAPASRAERRGADTARAAKTSPNKRGRRRVEQAAHAEI